MQDVATIRGKFEALRPYLDERRRRLWAAAEAMALGHGGITTVAAATGLQRATIRVGLRELQSRPSTSTEPEPEPVAVAEAAQRVRAAGGGRKPLTAEDPTLVRDLEALVEPTTRGDPMSPLRWTCKSTRQLATELVRQGHRVSHTTVAEVLHALNYSLQATRKTQEGSQHPDRDAQFTYLNQQTRAFQQRGQPVISVDCKQKELVGDFANGGREWQPAGSPEVVRVHDFLDKQLGKAIPYGVYDVAANQGWVSVGIDHETAACAVASIRQWWEQMGHARYPSATELLITADSGGSNGSHNRLWKTELQRLANATGLRLKVCHLPPGTSKWNVIEHRLFCHITQNWRGRPLVSLEVIINLLGTTTTRTGLKVHAGLDRGSYPTGIKVPDAELAAIQLEPASFHGDWNYVIAPHENGQLID
jgi:hypothetical protein